MPESVDKDGPSVGVSHTPSHLLRNLIIFPRTASHFLSIALKELKKELQGPNGRQLISPANIDVTPMTRSVSLISLTRNENVSAFVSVRLRFDIF